jgi:hypothetical protein
VDEGHDNERQRNGAIENRDPDTRGERRRIITVAVLREDDCAAPPETYTMRTTQEVPELWLGLDKRADLLFPKVCALCIVSGVC